ncbi:MAG: hypothetical protein A2Z88_04205 [Omnitrophica WOR_2 bacterium GWA2_47_8]|nr:MAG: hypothetical protein A2Z88_04205 [Omnitrophica WOR_2 bacterium GWA2_47_8]
MTDYKKRKKTFVLIIPRFEDLLSSFYAGEIIRGACLGASRLKTDILVHITDRENHRGWLDSSLLDRRYVDGIIFGDIDNDVAVVTKAILAGMPCMVLNNILNLPMNYVAINNFAATLEVMDYLIKAGHKKIATISGDLTTQAGQMRLEGYKQALKKNDLSDASEYIGYGEFLRTPARDAAKKILKLKDRPTAIFAASDVMALEVIDVAKSLNLKVPQDVSVIGFDDNPINSASSVKLTTVAQPLAEMGRVGVETLHQISLGKAKLPAKTILETRFIKRDSVKEIK